MLFLRYGRTLPIPIMYLCISLENDAPNAHKVNRDTMSNEWHARIFIKVTNDSWNAILNMLLPTCTQFIARWVTSRKKKQKHFKCNSLIAQFWICPIMRSLKNFHILIKRLSKHFFLYCICFFSKTFSEIFWVI